MNKNELTELLKQQALLVEFVKKDGSKRKMFCTLQEEHLPEVHGKSIIPGKDNLLTVWDLDYSDWRTINFEQGVKIL